MPLKNRCSSQSGNSSGRMLQKWVQAPVRIIILAVQTKTDSFENKLLPFQQGCYQ